MLSSKSDLPLQWTDKATKALANVKQALAQATLLFHLKPDAPTCIMTDASNVAIGAALQQFMDGQWCPLSFFSTKLRPPEILYSTFDRELLAIYLSIKHFRHFMEGRNFHVVTDHKPLTFAMTFQTNHPTP